MRKCINGLWENRNLLGPWSSKDSILQKVKSNNEVSSELFSNYLYGLLNISDETSIGCLSLTVREDDGSDWLDLCIPSAMLEQIFHVHYPPVPLNNECLVDVERLLVDIAQTVYDIEPFDLALLGEEVSGILYAETLSAEEAIKGGIIIPVEHSKRLGITQHGIILKDKLHYFS